MPQDELANRDGEYRVPVMATLDLQDLLDSDIPAASLAQLPLTSTIAQDDFEFDLGVDMLDAEHMADSSKAPLVPSLYRTPSPCVVLTSEANTSTSPAPHTDNGCSMLFEDTSKDTSFVCRQHEAVKADLDNDTGSCSLDMCLTDCSLATGYDTVLWGTTGPPPTSPLTSMTTTPTQITVPVPIPPTTKPHPSHVSGGSTAIAPSLTPPHSSSAPTTPSCTVTKPASDVTKGNAPPEIVQMPFYQFKKILECPDLPDQKKAEVKSMRRRGKNKMAAKNCRQRKLEVLMGLQQEVDKLKEAANRLVARKQGLEREIETLKGKCLERASLMVGTNQKQLITS